eukprot:COSAG05_NODE_240_length_13119_cov_122.275806_10_plen_73_part_00
MIESKDIYPCAFSTALTHTSKPPLPPPFLPSHRHKGTHARTQVGSNQAGRQAGKTTRTLQNYSQGSGRLAFP